MPLPGLARRRWWDGDRDQVVNAQVVQEAQPQSCERGAATRRVQAIAAAAGFLNPWGHEVKGR